MRSPLSFTYHDLLKEQENRLHWLKKSFEGMVITNQISDTTARRRIAMQQALVKMLKKHEKNRQLNLNEIFDQIK